MPPPGHDPRWPDKAMFAAILLILAGAILIAFNLVKPLLTIDEVGLPTVFVDDIPGYTFALGAATLVAGVLSLWRQAAVFAYLGVAFAVASLGVYGLIPILGLVALGVMAKSHAEGEETTLDEHTLDASRWPDKALAASLFLFVVGAIAVTQGLLLLSDHLQALVWQVHPLLAGTVGLAVGVLNFVAAREVFNLRRSWLGWTALVCGLATLGFYLIGPLLAIVGMVMLVLAHREDEFTAAAAGEFEPKARGRRKRTRPASAKAA